MSSFSHSTTRFFDLLEVSTADRHSPGLVGLPAMDGVSAKLPFQALLRQLDEQILDILPTLRRRLREQHPVLLCHIHTIRVSHLPHRLPVALHQVDLIADEHDWNALWQMLIQELNPGVDFQEVELRDYVINKNCSLRSADVRG